MKTTKWILSALVVSFLVSCNREDKEIFITAEEATVNAKMDIANNDVTDIVELEEKNTYDNSLSGRTTEPILDALPSCTTVTREPDFGTPITPGTQVTKTIDFGTTGCLLASGNVVKGRIIITFVYNPGATTHTINYAFDNFYHNSIKFVGNKTFTRTMTTATATMPSLPIVTMNMDMTATFPNGNSYQRVGQRIREIVEGYTTPGILADNVYKVTGSWTTSFPNTTLQTSTITSPLYVKMSCMAANKPLIVSGVISIVRNGNTGTLDYGDGTCDNTALFTFNGNTYTIIIGN